MSDNDALKIKESDITRYIHRLVKDATSYLEETTGDRERAWNYYRGDMSEDIPVNQGGRSKAVSRDLRNIVKKLMPSIMRTIFGGEKIVEYLPRSQEDEEMAEQATDYVNCVLMPEESIEDEIYDAIMDALIIKTGILKWSAYQYTQSQISTYENISEFDLLGLTDSDSEVLEHETTEETDPTVLLMYPDAMRHSLTLRTKVEETKPCIECINRGDFLISEGATSIEDAVIVGERSFPTRSELISMGYDKEQVGDLAQSNNLSSGQEEVSGDYTSDQYETMKATQTVEVYEVYVKIDLDDDGIAELYRVVYGERGAEKGSGAAGYVILGQELVSEAPYAEVVAERSPHEFDGHSIYEDVAEIQRVKTVLLRGALDNTYAVNNPQKVVSAELLANPSEAFNGEWMKPILTKRGVLPAEAIGVYDVVPFIAPKAIEMMNYMDEVAKERTGISDASGGLQPDQISNVNNGVAMLAAESGIAQAEMMVRTLSRGGIKKAFSGLLRLIVGHFEDENVISSKVRGEWKDFKPSSWNPEMYCKVNIGLGGGTKERDMSALSMVLELQEKLLASFGADNPYVKPDQLYNAISKMIETAGLSSVEQFITNPDPQEIEARLAQEAEQPSPEEQKVQGQIEIQQAKLQNDMAKEEMKITANRDKEKAQMDADLVVKQAEIDANTIANTEERELDREKMAQEMLMQEEEFAQQEKLQENEHNFELGKAAVDGLTNG